jgi:transposase-like protein
MAEPVPAGSDVSAGTYRCTECGYELKVRSTESLSVPGVLERLVAYRERRRQRR